MWVIDGKGWLRKPSALADLDMNAPVKGDRFYARMLAEQTRRRIKVNIAAINGKKLMTTEDEKMGEFVYCTQHVGPHSTGWCTVGVQDKIPLQAKDYNHAREETMERGLPIFQHCDICYCHMGSSYGRVCDECKLSNNL